MYQLLPARSRSRGFTMIEVLITLVVLSIGLLGIASLHATAKRSSHQAWQRTVAVTLADDLLERIRINPGEAASYATGLNAALGGGSIATAPTDCAANDCAPDDVAAWDLWEWEQRLDGAAVTDAEGNSVGGLIEPQGCVVFTAADAGMPNSGQVRVIVTWRGTTETSDAVQAGEDVCGTGDADAESSRRQVVFNTYVVDSEDLYP